MPDFSNFLDVQTKTAWGRTLVEFASFCKPKPASLILDIGCGPGLLPLIFTRTGHTAFGVDNNFSLLAPSLSPRLTQADALQLPFKPATFDLITATNVLFLLPEPLLALQGWIRLLAPDGVLCLLNPSERLSISAATQLADVHRLEGPARESLLFWANNAETYMHWSEAEMAELLSKAGVKMIGSTLRVGPGFAHFARASLY